MIKFKNKKHLKINFIKFTIYKLKLETKCVSGEIKSTTFFNISISCVNYCLNGWMI